METTKKMSIFAKKMKEKRENKNLHHNLENSDVTKSDSSYPELPAYGFTSSVATGDMGREIHEENVAKLRNMSLEEIEESREMILSTINPSNLEFLKSKRHKPNGTNSSISNKPQEHPHAESLENSTVSELYNKGIHMDIIESDKIEWMKHVPEFPKQVPHLYEARFDFQGNLMPYVKEDESSNALFSHGDEPHRPGYSISELYQLVRSSVTSQRIIALNTLAAILNKESFLSDLMEIHLLNDLLESGLFFLLRFSLDDGVPSVYLSALHAMTSLLWRKHEMYYLLDCLGDFGDIKQPSMGVRIETLKSEKEVEEMSDADLAQLDLIVVAIRSNIIGRLRYILHREKDDCIIISRITKCLIRIAFHSENSIRIIVNKSDLLKTLISCYSAFEGPHQGLFIILLRIISSTSFQLSSFVVNELKIMNLLLQTIDDPSAFSSTVCQCMYLWQTFLHFNLTTEYVNGYTNVFHKLLSSLYKDDVNFTYGKCLISLLTTILMKKCKVEKGNLERIIETIEEIACIWMYKFENKTLEINNRFENIERKKKFKNRNFENDLEGFEKFISNIVALLSKVENEIELTCFKSKMKNLISNYSYPSDLNKYSILLNNSGKSNFSSNFPTIDVNLNYDPFIILRAFAIYLIQNKEETKQNSEKKSGEKIGENNLENSEGKKFVDRYSNYISKILQTNSKITNSNYWASRTEINFLYDLWKLMKIHKNDLTTELAFKLTILLGRDNYDKLIEIFSFIFNYPENEKENFKIVKNYFLNKFLENGINNYTFIIENENILPFDWFYNGPIFTLPWINFLENNYPNVTSKLDSTLRYYKLCHYFFDDDFRNFVFYLQEILKKILIKNEFNFDKEVDGNSFYDFYVKFVDEFLSDSYGNEVFGLYLMIPLQRRFSARYRILIWTEKCLVLRFLKVDHDLHHLPLSLFTEPCETNVNLINAYFKSIVTGTVRLEWSPIMYKIGIHHVRMFIKNYSDSNDAKRIRGIVEALTDKVLRNTLLNVEE